MSGIPITNYLRNTAAHLEEEFVQTLGQIPLFANLPSNLLRQIFQYSKFVPLKDKDRPIQQGMFDQELYVLLEGALKVFIQTPSGEEEQIDIIQQPFSLFGERCILGEQRGASIEAKENVLLLGIDLSSLPDLLEGLEDPAARRPDEDYQQNIDMYSIFAIVLTERLDRLIKDQYKLMMKIKRLREYVPLWKKDMLFTNIFNAFCNNAMPQTLDLRFVLHELVKKYELSHPVLQRYLLTPQLNTAQFYLELVRLHALGELACLDDLIFDFVQNISGRLGLHEYWEFSQQLLPPLPEPISLGTRLNLLYQAIQEANILSKPLSKKQFLQVFLFNGKLNPSALAKYLEGSKITSSRFSLAYVMYLVCQQCIYGVSESNKTIMTFLKYLQVHSNPRQKSLSDKAESDALVATLVELYQRSFQNTDSNTQEVASISAEGGVDDLLASLGL